MSNADALAPMFDVIEDSGLIKTAAPWLFLNAEPDHRLVSAIPVDRLSAVTPHKGKHDGLRALGIATAPQSDVTDAGLVLLRLTRDRAETLGLLAEAVVRAAPDAPILVFGENDEGIRTVEKLVEAHWPVSNRQAKRHARCFMFHAADRPVLAGWRAAAASGSNGSGYVAQPGLFSHDRIDPGSALLITQLTRKLAGAAADFGCGWGALSVALLKAHPALVSLDLCDVDHRAVEAAAQNVAALDLETKLTKRWIDLAREEPPARFYDVIVMNPPFHASNRPDPALGAAFLAAASKALKPGGQLFVVANRKLPYEPQLKSGFRSVTMMFEGDGYKVYRAMR